MGKSTLKQLAEYLGYETIRKRDDKYIGYGSSTPTDRSRDGMGGFICWASEINDQLSKVLF